MDATTRFDTNLVGAMPVIVSYFDRLDLGTMIDDLVPWEGDVPLGDLVEILVLNRLVNPKAMFKIGDWAEKASVTDFYGIEAEALNDDRLGRALERVGKHGQAVQAALVLKATSEFNLDVSQVHSDMTTVELFGAYEDSENSVGPHPRYGHTKSGRKNVKQIQQQLTVSADGGVPICQLPFDGNAPEAKAHLENLRKLEQLVGKQSLLYIADTKLDTKENLLTIADRKGRFLCGASFKPSLKEEFLSIRDQLRKIDYCPNSQAKRSKSQRDDYQAVEVADRISGDVNGRSVAVRFRRIYIWSEQRARDQAKTRERHLTKIREEFETIQRNLNKFSLKTREKIVQRLEKARSFYPEGALFNYELTQGEDQQFKLSWKIDSVGLSRMKNLEGVFVLKTNLPKNSHSLKKLLQLYRDQNCVERSFRSLKGKLAVAPMFLHKPERMAGLLHILVWALMVMSLMERAVRQELDGEPMYGIYPENRPSPSPTGKAMFECFETLSIVIVKHHGETIRRLATLSKIQRKIISMLGIDPRLRTFRRGCGM